MLTFLIIIGITIIVGIFKNKINKFIIRDICNSTVIGIFVAMAFQFLSYFAPVVKVPDQPVNLYSVRNSSEISGSFILGIGSINEIQTAFYSTKNADGGVVFQSIPLENIIIYEDNQDLPHLQTYHFRFASPWVYKIFIFPLINLNEIPIEFHIPTGSVLHDYSIK